MLATRWKLSNSAGNDKAMIKEQILEMHEHLQARWVASEVLSRTPKE